MSGGNNRTRMRPFGRISTISRSSPRIADGCPIRCILTWLDTGERQLKRTFRRNHPLPVAACDDWSAVAVKALEWLLYRHTLQAGDHR
jgi:hypothetical protein